MGCKDIVDPRPSRPQLGLEKEAPLDDNCWWGCGTHVSGGRMFSPFVMHVLAFRFTANLGREPDDHWTNPLRSCEKACEKVSS